MIHRPAPNWYAILLVLWLTGLLGVLGVARADTRLFDVEIIVFAQNHADLAQERWPVAFEPPVFGRYADLVESGRPDAGSYLRMRSDQFQLGGVVRRLQNSDRYDVLVHTGWRQPGLDQDAAAAVVLPPGGEPAAEATANGATTNSEDVIRALRPASQGLSGYVRVYAERFLHVEVNLRLLDPSLDLRPRLGATPFFVEDDTPFVVMDARRRMRSGELHYLDHSVLGVLVRVDRAD